VKEVRLNRRRPTYLAVLSAGKIDDDRALVVDARVPEISDSLLERQLSCYERRFMHETLHDKHRQLDQQRSQF